MGSAVSCVKTWSALPAHVAAGGTWAQPAHPLTLSLQVFSVWYSWSPPGILVLFATVEKERRGCLLLPQWRATGGLDVCILPIIPQILFTLHSQHAFLWKPEKYNPLSTAFLCSFSPLVKLKVPKGEVTRARAYNLHNSGCHPSDSHSVDVSFQSAAPDPALWTHSAPMWRAEHSSLAPKPRRGLPALFSLALHLGRHPCFFPIHLFNSHF